MSYEKVKSLTFNHKTKEIIIYSCSNNVFPKKYDERYIITHDIDDEYYENIKRIFNSMIDGTLQFLGSCKSKSKYAYYKVMQHLYDTYKACPTDLWGAWENGDKFSELKQQKIRDELFNLFLENIK